MKPNCYACVYRGVVPGDAHSCCLHPEVKKVIADPSDPFTGLASLLTGQMMKAVLTLRIKGDEHGISNGWFMWPVNFDPVWLEHCDGYTPKEERQTSDPSPSEKPMGH